MSCLSLKFEQPNSEGSTLSIYVRSAKVPFFITDSMGNTWKQTMRKVSDKELEWRGYLLAPDQQDGKPWREYIATNCAAGENSVTVEVDDSEPVSVVIAEAKKQYAWLRSWLCRGR